MRFVQFILFLIFLVVVVIFAVQNRQHVTLEFLNQSKEAPIALVVGAVYVLGMLSGWTVVGFLKRSIQRVTED